MLASPRNYKEDPKRTFDDLFGVFNDSLPDGWGAAFAGQGITKKRLIAPCLPALAAPCHGGCPRHGCVEYTPAVEQTEEAVSVAELDALADESLRILRDAPVDAGQLDKLIQLNGSSAGARPQILVNVADDYRIVPQGGGSPKEPPGSSNFAPRTSRQTPG